MNSTSAADGAGGAMAPLLTLHIWYMALAAPGYLLTGIVAAHGQHKSWWFAAHLFGVFAVAAPWRCGPPSGRRRSTHVAEEGTGHNRNRRPRTFFRRC